MMKRKLLAILLSLAMLITLLPPSTALAATNDNEIIVGGVKLTGSEGSLASAKTDAQGNVTLCDFSDEDWNIRWDGDYLTLRGATIKGAEMADHTMACVYATHGYYVRLSGNNELNMYNLNNYEGDAYTYGLYAENGDITIIELSSDSSGSLKHTGSGAYASATAPGSPSSDAVRVISAAVYVKDGNVDIKGGTLDLAGGRASTQAGSYSTLDLDLESYGICVDINKKIGSVNISGGSVTAKGGETNNKSSDSAQLFSAGIRAPELNITGGEVTASTSQTGSDYYNGVMADGGITITPKNNKSILWEIGDNASTITSTDTVVAGDGATKVGTRARYFHSQEADYVAVKSVTLEPSTLALDVDETHQLTASVSPDNATEKTVTWASSNDKVATVDSSGNVKAVGAGEATIAATAGGKSASCVVTVTSPVTSISVSQLQATLKTGDEKEIIATVQPSSGEIEWISSDPAVATVEKSSERINGSTGGKICYAKVTAVGPGEATITAKAKDDSGLSASRTVTVTQPVTGITLDQENLTLPLINTYTLSATVQPENASDKSLEWTSSNENVAKVDENGKVTAIGVGEATITATAKDGSGVEASCKVTVPPQLVTRIILDKTDITLTPGEMDSLIAKVSPVLATNGEVTWSSSDENVATVEHVKTESTLIDLKHEGKVTAVGPGEATITVTAKDDSGTTATCKVTVYEKTAITTQPQDAAVTEGESVTFSVEASGSEPLTYQWQESADGGQNWTDIGGATSAEYQTAATTLEMNGRQYQCIVTGAGGSVTSDAVTLTVNPALYTVTVETDGNGTASASPASATAGTTISLSTAPAGGFHFERWEVVAGSVTITDNVFTMPAENVTIRAIFEQDPPVIPSTPSEPSAPEGPATDGSEGWTDIKDEIADADDGDEIVVDMNDTTEVPAEIFESVAGKDVDVTFELEDGVSWTVNGTDIPTDAELSDLDLGVTMDSDGIPVNVINTITGERDSVQMTLAYDGEFGFTMTLSAPLGKKNAGLWANLYHYDEDAEAMSFEAAAEIDDDGNAALPMSHASQYAVVIDDHSHAAEEPADLPFTDVNDDDWFSDVVRYVYEQGLMTGTSDREFSPDLTTTRGMIVSILNRLEGGPTAEAAGFTDVADGDWYADAVNWAASEGIVAGYEDNTFRPNDSITREQLAAMLMNYAAWKGEDVSARAELSGYNDAASVSSWAAETVQWAVAEGLISGMPGNLMEPQGSATRAQVAAILERFLSE